jgi:nucleotide-binding universal stress UspA family protein
VRRFVLGFDGSSNARRALELLLRLRPDRRKAAAVISVVEPLRLPAASRLPESARASLHAELKRLHRQRESAAREMVEMAVTRLRAGGWRADGEVRLGAPLAALLEGAEEHRADVLMLGARAKRGAERLLLGSVASGALDSAPIPVLIVP